MRGALLRAAALCYAAAHVTRMPLADLRAYLRGAASLPSAGGGGPGGNFRGKTYHDIPSPPAFRIAHSRPVNVIVPVDTDAPDSPAYTSGPLPVVTYLPDGGNASSGGTARPLAAGIGAIIGTGPGSGSNGSNGQSNGSNGSNGQSNGSNGSNGQKNGSSGSNNPVNGSNGSNKSDNGSDGSNNPDNGSNGTSGEGSNGTPDSGTGTPGDSAGGSSDPNSGSGNATNGTASSGSGGIDTNGSSGQQDTGDSSSGSPVSPNVIPHGSGVDPAPANTDANAQVSDGDAVVFATDPESTEAQIPSTYLGVPLDQTWRREISSTANQTDDHADSANSANQSQGQADAPGYVPVTGVAPAAQLGGRCADFAGIPPALLPGAVARVFTAADIPHYDTQDRCNTYL